MVMIMVTSWYPPGKAMEVAKKFLEIMQKFPQESFEKPLLLGGVTSVKDGIRVIAITEVEKGKYEEALNLEAKRLVEYMSIEGYRFEIETLMTLEEAMPLLGLEMPSP
jgi:hypothetical protein